MSEEIVEERDRSRIERWLRANDAAVHLYELGDLDDFFFEHTRWLALRDGHGATIALALLYLANLDLPVLLIMRRESARDTALALLGHLVRKNLLPSRFYAHLVPGIAERWLSDAKLEFHGRHDRMVLRDWSRLETIDVSRAAALGPGDREELLAFYAQAYPGNWFDARMLETGTYFGVRDERQGKLVSVAGAHVVSRAQRVAALGNIATDPASRGQGLGRIVTAAVVKGLGPRIDPIGLNVASSNQAAIRVYTDLGFEYVTSYEEVLITR